MIAARMLTAITLSFLFAVTCRADPTCSQSWFGGTAFPGTALGQAIVEWAPPHHTGEPLLVVGSGDRILAWDGQRWLDLSVGPIGGTVFAMCVFNGDLIIAGNFTQVGGVTANCIARYDGLQWHALQDNSSVHFSFIYSIIVWNNSIVVGGAYQFPASPVYLSAATWDTNGWRSLGSPLPGGVPRRFAILNGSLYATNLSDSPSYLSVWDGVKWSTLLVGQGNIYCVISTGDAIVVGTDQVGITIGNITTRLASWNGNVWQSIDTIPQTKICYNLLWSGGKLFAEAELDNADVVARLDGSTWTVCKSTAECCIPSVQDMQEWRGLPAVLSRNDSCVVQRIEGNQLSTVQFTSFSAETVSAATQVDNAAYLSYSVGGNSFFGMWDGSSLTPLGAAFSGSANCFIKYHGDIYAAGQFSQQSASGSIQNIARFDGNSWLPVGGGANGAIYAMEVFNDELVVGGSFLQAGGQTATRLAAWNGSSWRSFGSGVGTASNSRVRSMCQFQNNLIVGGNFTRVDGNVVSNVAAWNGTSWSDMAGGTTITHALAVQANSLVAGLLGTSVSAIRLWTGSSWQVIAGSQLSQTILMAPFGNRLALIDSHGLNFLDDPINPVLEVHPAKFTTGNPSFMTQLNGGLDVFGTFVSQMNRLPVPGWIRWNDSLPPAILVNPIPMSTCIGRPITLQVGAIDSSAIGYRWRHNGFPLHDDANIQGAATSQLTVAHPGVLDLGSYDCLVSNPCSTSTSAPAQITACVADLTCDNQVDDADFSIFVVAYDILDCADPTMPGGCPADLNGDGLVDDSDFSIFVVAYDVLVCP